MAEKAIGLFLILLNIFYLTLALRLEKRGFTTGELGPEVFPIALSITLFVLCFLLLIKETVFRSKAPSVSTKIDGSKLMILLPILLMTVYILVLPWVGFLISTPVFLILFALVYRVPNWRTALCTGIVTTLILYGAFNKFFHVILP